MTEKKVEDSHREEIPPAYISEDGESKSTETDETSYNAPREVVAPFWTEESATVSLIPIVIVTAFLLMDYDDDSSIESCTGDSAEEAKVDANSDAKEVKVEVEGNDMPLRAEKNGEAGDNAGKRHRKCAAKNPPAKKRRGENC
jgi:hypothetical protein